MNATIIRRYTTREERDENYRALIATDTKHVSRSTTSEIEEQVNPETGEVIDRGRTVYLLTIGLQPSSRSQHKRLVAQGAIE